MEGNLTAAGVCSRVLAKESVLTPERLAGGLSARRLQALRARRGSRTPGNRGAPQNHGAAARPNPCKPRALASLAHTSPAPPPPPPPNPGLHPEQLALVDLLVLTRSALFVGHRYGVCSFA